MHVDGHMVRTSQELLEHYQMECVIGVAPGAEIIPIKVLSDAGWGSWSGVIDELPAV